MSAQPQTWFKRQELTALSDEWYEQRIRTLAEVQPVIDDVVDCMSEKDCSDKDVFAVRLILEEALVNALVHGNGNDARKCVTLRCCIFQGCIVMEIEDEGAGFDPAQVADPLAPENLERDCGRGLLLMRSYSSWMCHNERGNRVTMCRARA